MNEEERLWGTWLVCSIVCGGGEKREIGQGEGGRVCEYGYCSTMRMRLRACVRCAGDGRFVCCAALRAVTVKPVHEVWCALLLAEAEIGEI